ncbi:MAG: CBS domain-containing protein [Desulfobacterales bacterium]|jgi:CBS domain-containing protein|nr:CBS domain-containing protein [Desulfobacterales bacterium]
MKTIKSLLAEKGHDVWSISSGETVYKALELMAEKNIGALMVIDDCKVIGIITERDYCRKVILKGKSSYNILVGELMTTNLTCATPEDTLDHCLSLMVARDSRHLPIFDHSELVGIVTLADVVKQMLSKQQIEIDNFENLVYGGYRACDTPSTPPKER